MGNGKLARFETWPWALRIIGLACMVPGTVILIAEGETGILPLVLIGAVLTFGRHQIVFDPVGRWVQRRIGIVAPLIRLERKSVTQVVLQERMTGSNDSYQLDYHVMVVGEAAMSVSVAKHSELGKMRRQAEELARSAHLPLLDLATGAGLRPAGTLDQSLRSRVRQMGWQPQPLGSSGRLRAHELPGFRSVELPELPILKQLLFPIGLPAASVVVFGLLAMFSALGLGATGHDPVLIAMNAGLTLLSLLCLIACIVIYRDRFVRVHAIEVSAAGLVIRASRFGHDVSQRFALDDIESVGIGGRAKLSGYTRETDRAVVIVSDQLVVSAGIGLTSAEQGWLAAFLAQAVATV